MTARVVAVDVGGTGVRASAYSVDGLAGEVACAPLDRTLKPVTGTKLGPEESQVVDTLTSPNHYLYDIQPTQDLAAIMRLVPVPIG